VIVGSYLYFMPPQVNKCVLKIFSLTSWHGAFLGRSQRKKWVRICAVAVNILNKI